jgi:hypothetical protein
MITNVFFFTGLIKAKIQVTSAPDLRSLTTELWIRILLFSSDAKNQVLFTICLLQYRRYTYISSLYRYLESHSTVHKKLFLVFFP